MKFPQAYDQLKSELNQWKSKATALKSSADKHYHRINKILEKVSENNMTLEDSDAICTLFCKPICLISSKSI